MLKISEYLYYQTKTSLKKDLEKLLDVENAHILLSHKKIAKKIKKSSSQRKSYPKIKRKEFTRQYGRT